VSPAVYVELNVADIVVQRRWLGVSEKSHEIALANTDTSPRSAEKVNTPPL
jgi:hypothetical protein